MFRKIPHGLVVMAVTASLLLLGVAPAHAHDPDDVEDVLEVHDIIDHVVHDILAHLDGDILGLD